MRAASAGFEREPHVVAAEHDARERMERLARHVPALRLGEHRACGLACVAQRLPMRAATLRIDGPRGRIYTALVVGSIPAPPNRHFPDGFAYRNDARLVIGDAHRMANAQAEPGA